MEHVDGVPDVETLAQPARTRGAGVDVEPLGDVRGTQRFDWVRGHDRWGWHSGQLPTVRTPEPQSAVGLPSHPVAVFVHGAVVSAADQYEIGQDGRPTVGPMAKVVALSDPHAAARELATLVSLLHGAAQGRRNRPSARSDLDDAPGLVVSHHHAARVAGQPSGRSRGNVGAVLQG